MKTFNAISRQYLTALGYKQLGKSDEWRNGVYRARLYPTNIQISSVQLYPQGKGGWGELENRAFYTCTVWKNQMTEYLQAKNKRSSL